MMESRKSHNYHMRAIIYNIYEDNILQNKKEIKFTSITYLSFKKDIETFGHCVYPIDAIGNPDHIECFKKNWIRRS